MIHKYWTWAVCVLGLAIVSFMALGCGTSTPAFRKATEGEITACHVYLKNVGTLEEAGLLVPVQVGKLLGKFSTTANDGSQGPPHNAVARAFDNASLDYLENGKQAHTVRDLKVISTACYYALQH